jgi:hypothetical protein
MIKHMGKTHHLGGIVVGGDIDMRDGEILNLSRLCLDKWSLVISDTNELCICYDEDIKARISNHNDLIVNIHCERYFMTQPVDVDDCIGFFVSNMPRYYNTDITQRAHKQALPTIQISDKSCDPAMIGIIVDYEKYERNMVVGTIESVQGQEDNINRVLVSNRGTSVIWITDINGPLFNGDYITTSEIPGYGMRQDDDIKHNYTGPKITQNCCFKPDIIILEQPVSFSDDGPVYEPLSTREKDVITDVEYEMKYVDKSGRMKTFKDFFQEMLSLADNTEDIYEDGILRDAIWYHPSRTIFRAAKVGCCFI